MTAQNRQLLVDKIQSKIDSGLSVKDACIACGLKTTANYYNWRSKFLNIAGKKISKPNKMAEILFKFNDKRRAYFVLKVSEQKAFSMLQSLSGLGGHNE